MRRALAVTVRHSAWLVVNSDAGEGGNELDHPRHGVLAEPCARGPDKPMSLLVDRVAEVNQERSVSERRQTDIVHA
jgi:hypothetical protein